MSGRSTKTPEQRFWAKVDQDGPNGCWVWTAARLPAGHGVFSVERRHVLAHRFSYELHFGPIPDGLSVCHRCDNPPCVNPACLYAGTHQQNMADMGAKGRAGKASRDKTHCPQDHEYTAENTFRRARGDRECRTCQRARCKVFRDNRKRAKS